MLMVRSCVPVLAAGVLSASAGAAIIPSVETFSTGPANWRRADGLLSPNWQANAGPGNAPFIGTSMNFVDNPAGSQITLLRAEDNFSGGPSSNGQFFGNWIAGGASAVSFSVFQNTGVDLPLFLRIARSTTNPAGTTGTIASPLPAVPSGVWTTITIPLVYSQSNWVNEGAPNPAFFNTVLSSVGRLQIGILPLPASLANTNVTYQFNIADVRLIPTPSAAAVLGLAGLFATRRRRR
jgi:hypothetical protein